MQHANLISSIYNDKHDIQVVNTRNNGTIIEFLRISN